MNDEFNSAVGKRILVSVDEKIMMTSLRFLSPNGEYGYFRDDAAGCSNLGWVDLVNIELCDIIGNMSESLSETILNLERNRK
jgi:hypothetical protein